MEKSNKEKAIEALNELNYSDVKSVYNGNEGCRCGCKGTYKYNPEHAERASKDRGYEVGEDEQSMRSIKITVNKMRKLAENCQTVIHEGMGDNEMIIDVREPHGRVHTIYYWNN